jgi:hypothetical protein
MFVYYEQAVNMRNALFCVVTQRVVLILYRRFFVGSWPLKMEPIVFPKRLLKITTTRCVMPQKSVLLIYFAAEGWNHPSGIYICLLYKVWRKDDVVIMATRLRYGRSEVRVLAGQNCSSLLWKVQTPSGAHLAFYSLLYFEGYSDRCIKLTTHLPLAVRLRMSGAKPPQPLRAVTACTGTYLLPLQGFRFPSRRYYHQMLVSCCAEQTGHYTRRFDMSLSVSSSGFKQN